MSFIFYNPNPENRFVGDCVIRAVSKAIGQDWDTTYDDICAMGDALNNIGANVGMTDAEAAALTAIFGGD